MDYIRPDYTCEREAQAELSIVCKEAGLTCRMEYLVNSGQRDEQNIFRFDLVVVENYQVIAIVEVKRYDHFGHTWDKEQIKRYKQFGIPVFILYSKWDIPHLVNELVLIQTKYLKSIEDTAEGKCNESDKQSKDRWEEKIDIAISAFNKTFPDYAFTINYSLEALAIAVKILGLDQVLDITKQFSGKKVEKFFFYLNSFVDFRDESKRRSLRLWRRKSTLQTVTSHDKYLAHIDKRIR